MQHANRELELLGLGSQRISVKDDIVTENSEPRIQVNSFLGEYIHAKLTSGKRETYAWMTANILTLNSSKAEFLLI